jgi:hypothetical protein
VGSFRISDHSSAHISPASMRDTYAAHLTVLYIFTPMTFGEKYGAYKL